MTGSEEYDLTHEEIDEALDATMHAAPDEDSGLNTKPFKRYISLKKEKARIDKIRKG